MVWKVHGSPRLKGVIRALLMVGNSVNVGTTYGNADGIRVDSLIKAADLRVRPLLVSAPVFSTASAWNVVWLELEGCWTRPHTTIKQVMM